MNIYATGASGYIGKALVKAGVLPICSDVTRPIELSKEIKEKKPDIILHLAAKSDPDFCQQKENISVVNNVNLRGAYNVAYHSLINNIPCVFFSSGQIWKGGFWEREHKENSKRTPPVNTYGISKLAAESIVSEFGTKIIRSSYVFDAQRLSPKLDALRNGKYLYEPTFIRRSFIYLPHFIELVLEYCKRIAEMPNTLHLAGSETVSWYDFTWELARHFGFDKSLVKPRRTEVEEDLGAPRPANAGLNTNLARSLGFRVPSYIDGIKRMRYEHYEHYEG